MANFCNRCGSPLKAGEPCTCPDVSIDGDNTILENIKNRFNLAGAVSPTELYERGKDIVPDCVTADEGEIPLRQYNVATLRSRLKFERAEGRLQVTNKRVLFRAKGTSLPGKTLLQYEFEVGEISGIEARSNYKFSLLNFFISIFLLAVVGAVITSLFKGGNISKVFIYIFGIAGVIPFFLLKKKSEIKLMCLGVSCASLSIIAKDTTFSGILGVLVGIITLIAIFLYMFVPNLVITFKTKGASPSVDVRAKKRMGLLAIIGIGNEEQEFTGFDEVLPSKDTITAINEVTAMINDLKTVGDLSIEKWKVVRETASNSSSNEIENATKIGMEI